MTHCVIQGSKSTKSLVWLGVLGDPFPWVCAKIDGCVKYGQRHSRCQHKGHTVRSASSDRASWVPSLARQPGRRSEAAQIRNASRPGPGFHPSLQDRSGPLQPILGDSLVEEILLFPTQQIICQDGSVRTAKTF